MYRVSLTWKHLAPHAGTRSRREVSLLNWLRSAASSMPQSSPRACGRRSTRTSSSGLSSATCARSGLGARVGVGVGVGVGARARARARARVRVRVRVD